MGSANRLVTDERAEFEDKPVEVQDLRRITDRFREILKNILELGNMPQNQRRKIKRCQHVTG